MNEPRLVGNAFFEYWSKLAAEDPDRFEFERAEALAQVRERAREHKRNRLLLLQMRLDLLRDDVEDPISVAALMSQLMWLSICGENGLLHVLLRLEGRCYAHLEARYRLLLAIKEGRAPT